MTKNIKELDIYRYIKNLIGKAKKNEATNSALKDIKNIVMILASVFLFLILWVNRINLSPDNVVLWFEGKICSFGMQQGFPYDFDGEKIFAENLKIYDGNIFSLTDTSYEILSGSGKLIRKIKHKFSNPCLKISGVRQIIYDAGGKNFKIESCAKSLYDKETEKEIITAAISECGAYAVVTKSSGRLAELTVYNKNNVEKYNYCFSDNYITNISLSPDGKKGIVSSISAKDGEVVSTIYVLNFKSEVPEAQFKLENNMVTDAEYSSSGKIVAIGDKYISFINPKTKTTNNYSYDEKILKFYDFSKDYGICFCVSSSVNETDDDEIISLDNSGKEMYKIKTSESLNSVSQRKNKIIGLSADKIICYNGFGKVDGYVDVKHHAKKVILLPHSYAYMLRGNTLSNIKLSHLKKYK